MLVFLVALSSFSFAQTGKITGKVTDKKTGESLIGLSVKIKGSTKGVSTNVDGQYSLSGLTPGKYTLDFSYIGYSTKSITDIEVKAAASAVLDVVMEESASQLLAEVVITSSARQESVNTLYAAQKNRAVISDGISSDQISRSPDKSTGEVLKRVSGTTIQDNKFVIVRGLGDRYNNARLDNTSLPSSEPNRKAFSFDIVPANLVDNIVISKTATPDLPGDFAGGSIQIVTRDIPASNFVTIGVGTGWNSLSTFKDFNYGPRYAINYLGFDNKRGLPSGNGFPKNANATDNLTPDQNIRALSRLPRVWNIGSSNAAPSQNHQLSMGKVVDFENGGRFGLIASLTYRNSQTVLPDAERKYLYYSYDDRVNVFSTNVGALVNLAYSKGKNKISFKNLYNRSLDDKFTDRIGEDRSRSSDVHYYAFDLLQKGLVKTTLEGEHQLFTNHKFSWNGSYANITNEQPDQRKVGYQRLISSRGTNEPFLATVNSVNKESNRFFSTLNEDVINGALNDQVSFKMFSQSATLKAGIGGLYRQRDFSARLMGMTTGFDQDIQSRPLSTLFGKDLIAAGKYRLTEITRSTDKYSANSFTGFGYAMFDNKLGAKSRLVWGARAEKFNLDLGSYLLTGAPLNVKNDYFDVLPSLNYSYALSPKSNLRASYYRTLARPEFRELAPFDYYDYEVLAVVEGNRNLKRTMIDNADLRYEIYPGAGEVFSVSAFYKHFNNAIEPSIYDVNSTPSISYFNTKQAVNYGAELEFRHGLAFINDESFFFRNTTFYVNGAIIKSNVKNPEGQGFLRDNRPMVGQSPYTLNAGIQHNALNNSLNLSLLYNRIGKRITNVGGQRLTDVWENPRNVLDFQANYRFLKQDKMQLKLNVSDILNNSALFYFDYTKDGKYSPGKIVTDPSSGAQIKDELFARYKSGANISLSLSYTLGK
ncbi:TonB-dependent receptor plug domain-containing protein [Pedobacter sp. HMF7056]|uniref:TonB-dependent receptor plug domain-containing protein n=1 Tax=Hufsiella ginkgonis TaxID=2695274 RepID=A0A7K1Y482_9SPHI|nr:TonB-dependent receptor plug domain-containing protein [Hufsiella ginkgonis]